MKWRRRPKRSAGCTRISTPLGTAACTSLSILCRTYRSARRTRAPAVTRSLRARRMRHPLSYGRHCSYPPKGPCAALTVISARRSTHLGNAMRTSPLAETPNWETDYEDDRTGVFSHRVGGSISGCAENPREKQRRVVGTEVSRNGGQGAE